VEIAVFPDGRHGNEQVDAGRRVPGGDARSFSLTCGVIAFTVNRLTHVPPAMAVRPVSGPEPDRAAHDMSCS